MGSLGRGQPVKGSVENPGRPPHENSAVAAPWVARAAQPAVFYAVKRKLRGGGVRAEGLLRAWTTAYTTHG